MISVKKITSPVALQKAWDIRVKVFVDEQGVDQRMEYEYEDDSVHFLAMANDDEPIGTARWRKTDKGIKLERFAVLKQYRGTGVGGRLVEAVLRDIGPTSEKLYLHAQSQVVEFYRKYGFLPQGDEFEEAGIKHFVMVHK